MLVEEKLKELESLLGPELVAGLLTKNSASLKAAEIAGLSFKAMTPPMTEEVVNAEQNPDKKLASKDDLSPVMDTPLEDSPVDAAGDGLVEEVEDPADVAADNIMADLSAALGDIVVARMQGVADEIKAALASIKPAAEPDAKSAKETQEALAGMTLALKENTQALTTVLGENAALKARLDALEGLQPANVRVRASQAGGLVADQLKDSHKALVDSTKANEDPYLAAAGNIMKGWPGQ